MACGSKPVIPPIEGIDHENVYSALDILSLPLLGIVYDDHEMIEANNKGTPLYLNKNSSGYLSFKNIVSRMEGKEVPFLVRKKKNRFIRWLKMHA